jgi:hypothetical protein
MGSRLGTGFAVLGLLLSTNVFSQVEGPVPVSVIARAEAKGDGTSLHAEDVRVEFQGRQTPVTGMRPLLSPRGPRVEVALMIDDSLRGNFGLQLGDIERFIDNNAAPNVAIGVGYMRNGRTDFPVGFSTEPEREKKAVRLPISAAGITGSPYFCLQDLVKHWPTNTGAAHVVLMITNGIDYYNGSVSPMNQNSPYVDSAVTDAQRAGVPVYSIYYGRREFNSQLGSLSGQSYLNAVAEGTGGKTFNGGSINPVSLSPYFRDFQRALAQSYVVSFQTNARKMQRLKLSTSVHGVKLVAQSQVGIAGAR